MVSQHCCRVELSGAAAALKLGSLGLATAALKLASLGLAAAVAGMFNLAFPRDVTGSMMHREDRLAYGAFDGYKAVELPYVSSAQCASPVRMLVILPDQDRFAEIEAAWDRVRLDEARAGLKSSKVALGSPRVRYAGSLDLKPMSKALGMPSAFDANAADFRAMSQKGQNVSEAQHKGFLSTDEYGTEAAAATMVVINADGGLPLPEEPKIMTVDRPFLSLICDQPTEQILFMGWVLDAS